jgi:hypothetical protein
MQRLASESPNPSTDLGVGDSKGSNQNQTSNQARRLNGLFSATNPETILPTALPAITPTTTQSQQGFCENGEARKQKQSQKRPWKYFLKYFRSSKYFGFRHSPPLRAVAH